MVFVWCYAAGIIGILIPFYFLPIQSPGCVPNNIQAAIGDAWNLAIAVEGDVVFAG
jgi:hypothetical protein